MKRIVLLTMMMVGLVLSTYSQDTIVLHIADYPSSLNLCVEQHQTVVVYAEPDCNQWWFSINWGGYLVENLIVIQSQVPREFCIEYAGCEVLDYVFYVCYNKSNVPNSSTQTILKRQGIPTQLVPVGYDSYYGNDSIEWFNYQWSTGETTGTIEVTDPGTYTCQISDLCGSATRTFIVRDNVELYRATVDLATGLNKITWLTTPEQAEYVSQVRVERDGMTVATVPYEDGQFIDNIGSENAARNYRLTAIGTDGTECPIPSYQKGTLHVDYSPNANNPNKLNMAWTPPFIEEGAPIAVSYFQICKYDPATGEVTVIDQIGANSTIASYDENLFDGGYATVAALFSESRAYDDMSFSNLTEDLLAVGEKQQNQTKIYPNPSNGAFTVEGTGNLRITNLLGQEILTKEINGPTTIELPTGVYFLRLNGVTRKIVVE